MKGGINLEQRHEIKMEFSGVRFTMCLNESEMEELEKDEEPDWTMCSDLRAAMRDGIRNFKKQQEGR